MFAMHTLLAGLAQSRRFTTTSREGRANLHRNLWVKMKNSHILHDVSVSLCVTFVAHTRALFVRYNNVDSLFLFF